MNAARTLFETLTRRGISLTAAVDGNLVVEPASRLTDIDRQAIRTYKSELLVLLTQYHDHPHTTTAENILVVCRKYGVALRIDEHGDLVVGKAGALADEPTQLWFALV